MANKFHNAHVLRAYFAYNPRAGTIRVLDNPFTARSVRRINQTQYRIGASTYSIHRIIWALHNPHNANPPFVCFADGDPSNTRIENLIGRMDNPRMDRHVYKVPMKQLPDGKYVPAAEYEDALAQQVASQEDDLKTRLENKMRGLRAVKQRIEPKPTVDDYDWEESIRPKRLTDKTMDEIASEDW